MPDKRNLELPREDEGRAPTDPANIQAVSEPPTRIVNWLVCRVAETSDTLEDQLCRVVVALRGDPDYDSDYEWWLKSANARHAKQSHGADNGAA